MITEIRHRYTNAVLWIGEAESLRDAVAKAVSADADLAGADLAGANLTDAYLAGANLADAYLADANLADAYLADADLTGADLADAYLADANLADAYLTDAYLAGANLAGANLTDAYLADANLADANLTGADLAGAYLTGAYLTDANLAGARNVPAIDPAQQVARRTRVRKTRQERAAEFRARNPDVPVVEHLDAKIVAVLESGEGKLDMSRWHSCETTHCRAGWAIHLAGKAGYDLEAKLGGAQDGGAQRAGAAIYRASTGRVPHFFASVRDARADIERRAAMDPIEAETP